MCLQNQVFGSAEKELIAHGRLPLRSCAFFLLLVCFLLPILQFLLEVQIYQSPERTTEKASTKVPKPVNYLSREKVAIVIAHCHEDLSWLSRYGSCDRISGIHVMSKCGEKTIAQPKQVKDCMYIHHIPNCGQEMFAYFRFIEDNYDDLPPIMNFIQGDSLPENPHIVHDTLTVLPGTSYKVLSRHVRAGWHFKKLNQIEIDIQNELAPGLHKEEMWLTGWRGMYQLSRREALRHPKSVYSTFNEMYCNKSCVFDCNLEIWSGALFRCVPYLFRESDCETHTYQESPRFYHPDYMHDSNAGLNRNDAAWDTHVTSCGDRSILVAKSIVNGMLMCVDHEDDRASDNPDYWQQALYYLNNETAQPDVKGIKWAHNVTIEVSKTKKSQWLRHSANEEEAKKLVSDD